MGGGRTGWLARLQKGRKYEIRWSWLGSCDSPCTDERYQDVDLVVRKAGGSGEREQVA
jgi:hypothetical protein